MKKNIAVFFGGVSCEHDISIITGVQAVNAIWDIYNVIPVFIDEQGAWYSGEKLRDISIYKDFPKEHKGINRVFLLNGSQTLFLLHKGKKAKPLYKIDAAVLAMHGLNGEDGSLYGLLQMNSIPVTSSGILGSAIGMDKISSKVFFNALGLNTIPYCHITRNEYMHSVSRTISYIENQIGYPVMVKPAMLGSSIGIAKCKNRAELLDGLEIAIRFDRRIICERAEENFIEINCSALKKDSGVMVSDCEQPVNWTEFLKFEDKYTESGKGMASIKRIFPAEIDIETEKEIKAAVKKIYQTLDLKGVIRADFIISDKVYINEINTIPGSLSYYLWENKDITASKLLKIMIEEAIEDFNDLMKCAFSFRSSVLKDLAPKGKN